MRAKPISSIDCSTNQSNYNVYGSVDKYWVAKIAILSHDGIQITVSNNSTSTVPQDL